MTDNIKFEVDVFLGSVELLEDLKIEGDKLWLGGHAVYRDKNGVITKVTEPEYYCCMGIC